MYNLLKLKLHNFRSYKGTHEFEFPLSYGLYFFKGLNNVELGSNGAGKSTFLDSILWALYGRTTRGLKANEIITWGETNCHVELTLTVGDSRLTIRRSQKPNKLTVNNKPVDQEELQKAIRLNYDSFMHSVINAQFGNPFLSLLPSDKLVLFSDIMGLDLWLQKSEEAAKRVKVLETEINAQEMAAARHDTQQVTLREDIISLRQDETDHADKQDEALRQLKAQVKATWNEKTKLEIAYDDLGAKASWLPAKVKTWEARVLDAVAVREQRLEEIEHFSREKNKHIAAHETDLSLSKRLRRSRGTCPTCLQEVSEDHIVEELVNVDARMQFNEKRAKNYSDRIREKTLDLVKAKSSLEVEERQLNDFRKEHDQLLNKISLKEAALENIGPRLDELGERVHQLERTENPYTKMLVVKRAKLVEAREALAKANERRFQLEAELVATSFWVKGFKRIRLFIIEQAFRTLEVEINNSLSQLGMSDWTITFDVERENKSGSVTKGFIVFVKGPSNAVPVRWENWSGGETQRLQLAADLGLANLIMQQNGLSNSVEFYDEPSTHLSPEGMMDLANLLHDRAVTENKQIWIVNHSSITNFGDFEGVITVRKNKDGSSISFSGS